MALNDLIRNLNYEEQDGYKIYTWENYQIIFREKECIIAPLDISINDVFIE